MNPTAALATTPALILKIEGDLFEQEERVARLELKADMMRNEAVLAVADLKKEVDGKQVKAFPNETAREQAAHGRLSSTPEWVDLQGQVRAERKLVRNMKATLQYHRDVQVNSRALVLGRSPFDVVMADAEAWR